MKRTHSTLYFFIVISCAIHAIFWLGQFELQAPVHTTGASNSSIALQVTLTKPKQDLPDAKQLPKPSKPTNLKTERVEKSQIQNQVMAALKNNIKTHQTSETKKANRNMGNTAASTSVLNKPQNILAIQVNLNTVVKNIHTEENIAIDQYDTASKARPKTLTQQQVASLNAHLNQAFNRYFSYPRLAQRNGWQGMVKLGLRIESNGQLSQIRVLSTSGFPVLDQAALNTLNRISSLQNVDDWLNGLHFDTVLPVQYKLVDS